MMAALLEEVSLSQVDGVKTNGCDLIQIEDQRAEEALRFAAARAGADEAPPIENGVIERSAWAEWEGRQPAPMLLGDFDELIKAQGLDGAPSTLSAEDCGWSELGAVARREAEDAFARENGHPDAMIERNGVLVRKDGRYWLLGADLDAGIMRFNEIDYDVGACDERSAGWDAFHDLTVSARQSGASMKSAHMKSTGGHASSGETMYADALSASSWQWRYSSMLSSILPSDLLSDLLPGFKFTVLSPEPGVGRPSFAGLEYLGDRELGNIFYRPDSKESAYVLRQGLDECFTDALINANLSRVNGLPHDAETLAHIHDRFFGLYGARHGRGINIMALSQDLKDKKADIPGVRIGRVTQKTKDVERLVAKGRPVILAFDAGPFIGGHAVGVLGKGSKPGTVLIAETLTGAIMEFDLNASRNGWLALELEIKDSEEFLSWAGRK